MKRYISLFLICVCVVLFTSSVLAAGNPTETSLPQKVEYALPYPGILADNPLYVLKGFRDRIMEWLIADPVKKIEFYILQGDKNLNAGVFLDAKGKTDLAKQAISVANKYMTNAVTMTAGLGAQGREVPAYVIERLQKSLMKHEEVIIELFAKKAPGEKSQYGDALQAIEALASEAAKLER